MAQTERSPGGQFLAKPAETGQFEPGDPGQVRAARAGAKLTVACKLPHGLILQLWRMETVNEPVMGGGTREIQIARPHPDGRRVVIHGNMTPFGVAADWRIVGGYGLTHNVDKDFFDQWLHDNRALPAVKNGLVFGYEETDRAVGQANEMAQLASGLEPLDPAKLGTDPRYKAIATARLGIEKAS